MNGRPALDKAQTSIDLQRTRERWLIKEVIQPHVLVRLPCYDFTLITGHNLEPGVPPALLLQPIFMV